MVPEGKEKEEKVFELKPWEQRGLKGRLLLQFSLGCIETLGLGK